MSGPKAVRVITREERVAVAERILVELEVVTSNWCRETRRLGLAADDEIAAANETRRKIAALLGEDKFREIDKQTRRQTAFLEADLEKRLEKRAKDEERKRAARRRTLITAATLLGRVEKESVLLPDRLKKILVHAGEHYSSDPGEVETAIFECMSLLLPGKQAGVLTTEQRKLAEKLSTGADTSTLSEWLERNPLADESHGQRIDAYIARLELEMGPEAVADFVDRAAEVSRTADTERRALLSNSLVLELSEASQLWQSRKKSLQELRVIVSQLEGFSAESALAVISKAEHFLSHRLTVDLAELLNFVDVANEALSEIIASEAARDRRSAMLTALSELGYEVREGVSTAWVKNSRVVLRQAASSDTGLEISGGAHSGVIQIRPVAFSDSAKSVDRARGIEIETKWCGDFQRLKKKVKDLGADIRLEKALAVGETPVKVVKHPDRSGRRGERVRGLRGRTTGGD